MSNKDVIDAVTASLSTARMGTYRGAVTLTDDQDMGALNLYAWNATISGSLLSAIHICEVVVRNAVSDSLTRLYGPRWPFSTAFSRSLPDPPVGYSPRRDISSVTRSHATTGKVIPELKFVFWQKMFTSRHDSRLWNPYIYSSFPNADPALGTRAVRTLIYNDLEQIRKLRNRIAHHEPIFARNLSDDYKKLTELVELRCSVTAGWLRLTQDVNAVLALRP
jgi:hypothetical protein